MPGPLAGIKILDFTTLLPGPFGTMLLADLGADVLRVEAPNRPDMMRLVPPYDGDIGAAHGALGRNKRSLGLDLKKPGAADIVKRLARTYDVVVEQFRPGVMERLGVGYEDLKAANPRVIYCSITGYGQTGPFRERAGHDNNYLSIGGVAGFSGRREDGPVPQGVQIADVGGGGQGAAISILAAYIHRERTGEGQWVDVSMTDWAMAWTTPHAGNWLSGGVNPRHEALGLNGGTYYDYYRAKDGGYMSVGSLEPHFWQRLCETIERPELIPIAMSDAERVKKEIAAAFATKTRDEWAEIFAGVDACVEPVLTMEEACAHPQMVARAMVAEVPKHDGKTMKMIGTPFAFSATPCEIRRAGGPLGEHTDAALAEIGYSAEEIARMRGEGLFG